MSDDTRYFRVVRSFQPDGKRHRVYALDRSGETAESRNAFYRSLGLPEVVWEMEPLPDDVNCLLERLQWEMQWHDDHLLALVQEVVTSGHYSTASRDALYERASGRLRTHALNLPEVVEKLAALPDQENPVMERWLLSTVAAWRHESHRLIHAWEDVTSAYEAARTVEGSVAA